MNPKNWLFYISHTKFFHSLVSVVQMKKIMLQNFLLISQCFLYIANSLFLSDKNCTWHSRGNEKKMRKGSFNKYHFSQMEKTS